MQTKFDKVIEIVKAEFEYSQSWDKVRKANGEPEHKMDQNKSVETWILWMEQYLANARLETTKSADKTAALHEIRQVASLAILCLVHQGCPERVKSQK